MKKIYPKDKQGTGVIISTYWNDKEWALLQEFKQGQGITADSTAIKQGFLFGTNLIGTLSKGDFAIKIKAKK